MTNDDRIALIRERHQLMKVADNGAGSPRARRSRRKRLDGAADLLLPRQSLQARTCRWPVRSLSMSLCGSPTCRTGGGSIELGANTQAVAQ